MTRTGIMIGIEAVGTLVADMREGVEEDEVEEADVNIHLGDGPGVLGETESTIVTDEVRTSSLSTLRRSID
jgi:hypothetical protein